MRRSMQACGALFVAIGLAAIGVALFAAGEGTVGVVLFGAMFLAGGALFFWVGSWGVLDTRALEDADLRRYGRPAAATVLHVDPATNGRAARVTLRVRPVNERAFEATTRLASGSSVAAVGGEVRVTFDPNKRGHLVIVA